MLPAAAFKGLLASANIKPKSFQEPCLDDESNKTSSSCSSPNNSPEIPRNILAFRTITTLLHLIQQEELETDPEPPIKERSELRLLNSLATVAITEHDIVAVTSKNNIDGLELIASTTCPPDPPPQRFGIISFLQDCALTWNPQRQKPETSTPNQYPILYALPKPADFKR
jgi:hypothetical protein